MAIVRALLYLLVHARWRHTDEHYKVIAGMAAAFPEIAQERLSVIMRDVEDPHGH